MAKNTETSNNSLRIQSSVNNSLSFHAKVLLVFSQAIQKNARLSGPDEEGSDKRSYGVTILRLGSTVKHHRYIQKIPQMGDFLYVTYEYYLSSTFAPAASSFFLASSAAALLTPVNTSFGAASTSALAS